MNVLYISGFNLLIVNVIIAILLFEVYIPNVIPLPLIGELLVQYNSHMISFLVTIILMMNISV